MPDANMNLAQCRDCAKPVSYQAATCPHCGTPFPALSHEQETRRLAAVREGYQVEMVLHTIGALFGIAMVALGIYAIVWASSF